MEYEPVIGLEVHVQLNTATKLFCGCSTAYAYQPPNTFVCPVCLGLPGVLPVLNEAVLTKAVQTVLALGGDVAPFSKFDRKNYFYPDLPKAYQISQYDRPIGVGGGITISVDGGPRRISLRRVHMEEDAGKLMHEEGGRSSLVDYNRAGVPLLEIVSDPELHHPDEAKAYLEKLKAILEYLGVSTCNMEEGTLRCDANVSLKPKGSQTLGTRTEIKNLNSFRWVARAISYEIERQGAILDRGEPVTQETRLFDADRGTTESMRGKEDAHDYRYFPEPDLPPIALDPSFVEAIRSGLPELPDAREERFVRQYKLPPYDAHVLTSSRDLAQYYEDAVALHGNPKALSNWTMVELAGRMNEAGKTLADMPVTPAALAELVGLIDSGAISGKIAKDVFDIMFASGQDPAAIVKEKGWAQVSDTTALREAVCRVLDRNPGIVAEVLGGKDKARGYLVGQVMRETRGQGNPALVNQILAEELAARKTGGAA